MNVFRSRISVLLIVSILAILIPAFLPVFKTGSTGVMLISGGILSFIFFIFTGIRYIVSGGKLYIKIWFISAGNVNIADIRSVRRSYNPLSSPAASLKRLNISLRTTHILISPVREQQFIDLLKSINPDIDVDVPEKRGLWRIWDWDI